MAVTVSVTPRIQGVSPNESSVPVGGPFSLKCGARGYPQPTVAWTLNDKAIVSGQNGMSVAEDGTLFVERAPTTKVMIFRCTAENEAGTDEKEYTVKTVSK